MIDEQCLCCGGAFSSQGRDAGRCEALLVCPRSRYMNSFSLQGWTTALLSDEVGSGISIMNEQEGGEDAVGDVSNEDITKDIPEAARSARKRRKNTR